MEAEVSSAEDLEEEFLKVVEEQGGDENKKVTTVVTDVTEDLVKNANATEDIPTNCDDEIEERVVSSRASSGSRSSGQERKGSGQVGVVGVRRRGGRSSLPPSLSHYSSSSEDTVSGREVVQVRRRKKRKRPVGEQERKTRQKSVWIEEALRAGDKDRLGQLAVCEGGLMSDEVRKYDLWSGNDGECLAGQGEGVAQAAGYQHVGDGHCPARGGGAVQPPRV